MIDFAPFGLIADAQDQAAMSYSRTYPNALLASGAAYSLFSGQPVTRDVATGYFKPVAATTDEIAGVFYGIVYFDATNQTIVESTHYIAGTPLSGYIDPQNQIVCKLLICDVNDTIFRIQATGPITGGQVATASQFNLNIATATVTQPDGSVFPFVGNTDPLNTIGSFFGNSYACLNPAAVTTADATAQFICWGNAYLPGNQLTDQFPVLLVKVNLSNKYAPKAV